MNRRCFINKVALTTAGVVSTGIVSGKPWPGQKAVYKITVLKTLLLSEFKDELKGKAMEICPLFKEKQEFELHSPWNPPEGFCNWAWADIRPYILQYYYGREEPSIVCCTDGLRPVIFKVECLKM